MNMNMNMNRFQSILPVSLFLLRSDIQNLICGLYSHVYGTNSFHLATPRGFHKKKKGFCDGGSSTYD